jgi:hypothetical protein
MLEILSLYPSMCLDTGGTAGLVIVALALSFRPTLGFVMGAALLGQLALGEGFV